MTNDKMIIEMANDYYGYSIDLTDDCTFVAEEMYNKGHRKLSKDDIVISKNEYNELKNLKKNFEPCFKAGYEQAIKKFKTFIFSERIVKSENFIEQGAIVLFEDEVQDFFNSMLKE